MSIPAQKRIEGKYEILDKLREGGMGALYKVRHLLLDEVRVIKVMKPQMDPDEELRLRFLREARVAVRLRHPNIAQLYDFTVDEDGTAFMVMEFIDGMNLVELLRATGPLPVALVLDISIQSLEALCYLHRSSFVHRDISPDNLMLTKDADGRPLVKLIDLGIAKPLVSEVDLTRSGYFIGKVRYASPEQFGGPKGEAEVDQRSDLYSLGVVLYELLTGVLPISGDDYKSALAGHLFHPPRDFSETDREGRVPLELRAVLLRSLEKDPAHRYLNAEEFSRELAIIREEWSEPETDIDTTAATLPMHGAPGDRDRPGSTQERLDRQFRPESTPPPTLPAPPPLAAADRRTEELAPKDAIVRGHQLRLEDLRNRADKIVEEARLLADSGRLEEALKDLQKVAGIDAGHVDAGVLRTKLKKALAERSEKVARCREKIESHLAQGELVAAEQALEEAVRGFGDIEDFGDLGRRLEHLRAQEARERAISRSVQNIERKLELEGPEEAGTVLSTAIDELGEDPRFTDLATRIEEEKRRRRHFEALLRSASVLAEAEDHGPALAKLEEARSLDPENIEVEELLVRCRSGLERQQRRQERRDAQREAAAQVGQQLEKGDLEGAERSLDQAAQVFGPAEAFDTLRAQIENDRAKRRREQAAELLTRAEELAASGRLEAAGAAVEESLALDPRAARARTLLAEITARQREQERQRTAAEARRTIEAHLEIGELDEAGRALAVAVGEHGELEDFGDLRSRLDNLKSEAVQARGISKATEKIELLLARDHFDRAAAALEAARKELGREQALQDLELRIEEARGQWEVEQERSRQQAAMASPGVNAGHGPSPNRRRLLISILVVGAVITAVVLLAVLRGQQPGGITPTGPLPMDSAPDVSDVKISPLAGLLDRTDLGSFHALVIGNNNYQKGLTRLETALPDAEELARVLAERYGFEVTLLRDADRYGIFSELEQLTDNLTADDNLLIFYAGHGFLNATNGQGYWQPVDAEPDNPANWISTLEISDLLLDAAVKRVLVVADSCFPAAFGGPVDERTGTQRHLVETDEELESVLASRARLALTSGDLQPVLDTGAGGRSVFSNALLEVLAESSSPHEAAAVFVQVENRVREAAARMGVEQDPQFLTLDSHDGGAFFFVPRPTGGS